MQDGVCLRWCSKSPLKCKGGYSGCFPVQTDNGKITDFILLLGTVHNLKHDSFLPGVFCLIFLGPGDLPMNNRNPWEAKPWVKSGDYSVSDD